MWFITYIISIVYIKENTTLMLMGKVTLPVMWLFSSLCCRAVLEGGEGAFRFVLFKDEFPRDVLPSCREPVLTLPAPQELYGKQSDQIESLFRNEQQTFGRHWPLHQTHHMPIWNIMVIQSKSIYGLSATCQRRICKEKYNMMLLKKVRLEWEASM